MILPSRHPVARFNNLDHSAYGGPGWSPRLKSLGGELGTVWTKCGINSEYSRLKTVLLHRPGDELSASKDPKVVQMLGKLDIEKAQEQHDALSETYRNADVTVHYVKPGEPVSTAHGTGPYKMDSFKQGDKVVMSKFDNYSPNVGEEWNFTKGEIVQYLDGFVGFDIPDHAARVAALQTNEVDVLDDFKIDLAFDLQGVEDVTWGAYKDGNYGGFVFNAHHAPFDMSEAGRLARRAVTAALNNEKVMKTAVGNPSMWRPCYLVIHCGNGWTSVVTDEVQAEGIKTRTGDMVYAKKLLAEAEALSPGISEMPVRIINSFDVAVIAEESLVMWESLINLGFKNAEIMTMDWGSGAGMVGKDGPWEIFTQWSNFANGLNPLAPHMFSGKTGNGYVNPKIDELRAAFLVETDPATQQSLYDDMNRTFYENPPSVNNFQFASPRAHRNEVKNFCLDCLYPILHNVWLD